MTDFPTEPHQTKFNLYYALFESKFSDLFLALMFLYTKGKEFFKTMVYVQVTRNNAWTSLGVVLCGHLKIDPRNVSMFVAKKRIVCNTVLVLIAIAIVAKPLGEDSWQL